MPRPDLVVITGDLVDVPSVSAYGHLKRLLTPLRIPFAVVPGNHDGRGMLRDVWPDRAGAAATKAHNLIRHIDDLDIVLVDSTVPGAAHGELDAETLVWLDSVLGKSTTRSALVFLHHPPFATGIAHMDAQNLRNAPALGAAPATSEAPVKTVSPARNIRRRPIRSAARPPNSNRLPNSSE